ncbi:alpha/beta fold hydrolase [Actinoplanes derwentensis]|uniref:Pimeloyl-ACP methyl ester carboxylesterase n=1 Tax=Actinoplanes derwentensis TaxID=113562 RepID=A0A1H2C5Z7_9ACTN|nr:alpha/beta hydrolase [Actinoplanes derwentensis]GID84233.1 alpha/beta hydrolase [Actinoplanes derwentensis]SDT65945.1 Pimeloyl-ACP methyl ester carboxylesterase [Actinoplanes derwentensis]
MITLADGIRLNVSVSGPQDAAVTVVLSHGWCQDRRTWRHQIEALSGIGRKAPRVIAYDTRGHGRSSATDPSSATLAQLGDDMAEVIRHYAPTGPVVLAGHSMGGMTVMEYAHRHRAEFTSRVAGLLLVSTTAEGHAHTRYGLPPQLATVLRLGETLGAGLLARSGAWHPHRVIMPALRPALRWLLFGDECGEEAMLLTMRALGRAPLSSIGGFRGSIGTQRRLDTLAELGDMPAAVLVGGRDRLTPPACAESIARALPCAEMTVVPGAGHMLPLEQPEAVSAALLTVVRRVARQAKRARRPITDTTRCQRAA